MDVLLHAHLDVLAERRRRLLLHPHPKAPEARHVQIRQDAIASHICEHSKNPKPFVWTKTAKANLAKLDRPPVPSE
jgi:hypothetical protein